MMPDSILVLAAHGSRRAASNEEVRHLAQVLTQRAPAQCRRVLAGFLELAAPSITEAIDAAVADNPSEVVVVPYFLSAGRHVALDLPALVEECRRAHPQARIRVTDHLGAAETALADMLLGLAGYGVPAARD